MKKTIITALLSLGLMTSLVAQQLPAKTESLSYYKGNELSLALGLNYANDSTQEYAPALALTYFVTKNLGVRALTKVNMTDVTAFDNVELVGLLRYPLGRFAPYVGGGVRYQGSATDTWSPVANAGLEFRVNQHWGLVGEYQYDFQKSPNFNYQDSSFRVFLNLVF